MTIVPGDGVSSIEVNVLQAINLTLGTSAFLALADSLPDAFGRPDIHLGGLALYVTLLLLWIVKLLVENHRGFVLAKLHQHPRYAIFQLAMTIFMSLALIAAARKLDNLTTSTLWLAISLAFGALWLAGKVLFHVTTGGFRWSAYPWHWLASDVITVLGAGYISVHGLTYASGITMCLVAMMAAAVVADAVASDSFAL